MSNTLCLLPLRAERDGQWVTWTYQQYYTEVAAAAKSMIRLGLERFHGVCILGFNAPEWFMAYLGGIMVSRTTNHYLVALARFFSLFSVS